MSPSPRSSTGLAINDLTSASAAPRADAATDAVAPAADASGSNGAMPIVLMIDDETSLARAMEVRLRAIGVEFRAASTGAQGLALARRCAPALIVLDVRLPDMDGFETLRSLRAEPALRRTPVIFVTASANETTRNLAREAGATAFFAKPFEGGRLLQAIERELLERAAVDGEQEGVEI